MGFGNIDIFMSYTNNQWDQYRPTYKSEAAPHYNSTMCSLVFSQWIYLIISHNVPIHFWWNPSYILNILPYSQKNNVQLLLATSSIFRQIHKIIKLSFSALHDPIIVDISLHSLYETSPMKSRGPSQPRACRKPRPSYSARRPWTTCGKKGEFQGFRAGHLRWGS